MLRDMWLQILLKVLLALNVIAKLRIGISFANFSMTKNALDMRLTSPKATGTCISAQTVEVIMRLRDVRALQKTECETSLER